MKCDFLFCSRTYCIYNISLNTSKTPKIDILTVLEHRRKRTCISIKWFRYPSERLTHWHVKGTVPNEYCSRSDQRSWTLAEYAYCYKWKQDGNSERGISSLFNSNLVNILLISLNWTVNWTLLYRRYLLKQKRQKKRNKMRQRMRLRLANAANPNKYVISLIFIADFPSYIISWW